MLGARLRVCSLLLASLVVACAAAKPGDEPASRAAAGKGTESPDVEIDGRDASPVLDPRAQIALSALLAAWDLPPDDREHLALRDLDRDDIGHARVSFDQLSGGYPVYGQQVLVNLDDQGRVIAINGRRVAMTQRSWAPPQLSVAAAIEAAGLDPSTLRGADAGAVVYLSRGGAELVYALERYDGLRRTFVFLSVADGHIVDELEGTYSGGIIGQADASRWQRTQRGWNWTS